MGTNNIIQSLWIGDALSDMEVMCINSYLLNGHEFHLYSYNEIQHVPTGTMIKDANEIIPKKELFIDQFGGFVNLSNLFRYTLLFKKGNWWVDMDTVCLRKLDIEAPYVFSSEYSDPYNRHLVNTTFIKSPKGASFLKDCIDHVKLRGHEHLHWGELGVNLISRMIFRHQLKDHITPYKLFCPVSAYQLNFLLYEPNYQLPSEAYALHWWNEIWRRAGIDKNGTFTENSQYDILKRKYIL